MFDKTVVMLKTFNFILRKNLCVEKEWKKNKG